VFFLSKERELAGNFDFQIPESQRRNSRLEEATMIPRGAVFQPELIELMRTTLDEVTATLPEAKRTSATKADMASAILACAAKGERDPVALKTAAMSTVVQRSHYPHDISPERRVV
jgi:hypothetical protein